MNVPPSSSFFARIGSALALSGGVEVGLSTEGGVLEGLARKLTGGSMLFNRVRTSDCAIHAVRQLQIHAHPRTHSCEQLKHPAMW